MLRKNTRVATVVVFAMFMQFLGCSKFNRKISPPSEKIFRYLLTAKTPNLDPHITTDVYSSQVEGLVYDQLYQFHFLKRPYQAEPMLAAAMPTWSKDRKTMRIPLKKGIYFHNDPCFKGGKGREVTADDVVYFFHRVAAPKFAAPIYGGFEGNIVGIDDYHNGKAATISGIKKIDPYGIEIQLTKKLPRFLYNFVGASSSIVPKECVEYYKDEFHQHPVGSGPFQIEKNTSNKIVLLKNPNYKTVTYPTEGMPGDAEKGLLKDAGKQLPLLDKVVYEVLAEDQPTWLKFVAGETEMSRIPKDNVADVIQSGKISPDLEKRGIRLERAIRGDVTVHIFNMENSPWGKKKELRQAVALALDVDKIIEVQYSSQAVRAHSLIDPGQYGYDPAFKSRWSKRNVAKAKELLAKAGYPDGKRLPPLEMLTVSGALYRILDELMTRSLAEAGIVLKSEVMTWPELVKKKNEHRYVSVGMGYASDVPDADGAFAQYHSRGIPSGTNAAAYRNPKADKLIDEIEALENGPERLRKIAELKNLVDEDLPYIPLVHRMGNQLVQPWVSNHVYTDQMFLATFLKYLKVNGEK